jgi:hypothetical protein
MDTAKTWLSPDFPRNVKKIYAAGYAGREWFCIDTGYVFVVRWWVNLLSNCDTRGSKNFVVSDKRPRGGCRARTRHFARAPQGQGCVVHLKYLGERLLSFVDSVSTRMYGPQPAIVEETSLQFGLEYLL